MASSATSRSAETGLAFGAMPALQAGDPVHIDCGPFARLDAICQRFGDNARVIVLLDMLQKQHQLTLKLSDVSPQ